MDFIKQKLRERWTAKQIQAELSVKVGNSTISAINNGQNWRVEGEKYPISRNNGHRKFSDEQVREIRQKFQEGSKIIDLTKEYHTSPETIRKLVKYETYKDV